MTVAKPLGLRLFIEGVEFPVIAAQVSIGVNSPSAASVQIIPLDEALDLRPRSMVHLFFLDADAAITQNLTEGADQKKTPNRNTYRLLFAGETVGYGWSQNPQSRSIVLQCLDFSNYWDSAHASAIEYGPGGNPFHDSGAVYGGNGGTFDDLVDQQPNKIVEWIKQRPKTPGLETVSGLAGGIIRMLEAIAGIPGYHAGINDFFTFAELRCRVLAQITAEENDNTARNLIDTQVMDQWIMSGLQNMGRTVTFRQMMNLLFQYIYYESVPNPAAKFDTADAGHAFQIESGAYSLQSLPAGIEALAFVTQAQSRLTVDSSQEDSGWKQDMYSRTEGATADLKGAKKALVRVSSTKKELKTDMVRINNALDKAIASISTTEEKLQMIPNVAHMSTNDATALQSSLAAVNAVIELMNSITGEFKSYTTSTTAHTQRLRSHIIRPDCWFSAPPRCNVIFPEYFTQVSYDRNLIGDVSRSLVQFGTKMIGPDAILDNYVMFPYAVMAKDMTSMHNEGGYRVLMPHEVHTGIIPRSEWMPDTHTVDASGDQDKAKLAGKITLSWASRAGLFNFFKYRFAPRQMQVAMRFNPFLVCGFPALLLRQPYIIEGLTTSPDLPTADVLNAVNDKASENHAPNHFIGMVGSVNHSIDQNGGVTSILMHSVRRHQGVDDDFLDLFKEEPVLQVVKTQLKYESAVKSKEQLAWLVGCTPQTTASNAKSQKYVTTRRTAPVTVNSTKKTVNPKTGKTSSAKVSTKHSSTKETTDSPATQKLVSGRFLTQTEIDNPFVEVGEINGMAGKRLVPVPNGLIHSGSKNGKFQKFSGEVVGVEVLNAEYIQTPTGRAFKEVILYERYDTGMQRKKPIEEMLRPPWFSPSYKNVNIGPKIYMPFFGCGSLIDDLKIQGLLTTPTSNDVDQSMDASSVATDKTVDQAAQDILAALTKDSDSSIEKAVNIMAFIYGRVKSTGLDIDSFVRSYIDRPIATIDEILGSEGLQVQLTPDGEMQAMNGGSLGFHTAAIHRSLKVKGQPLVGLLKDPDIHLNRIGGLGKTSAFNSRDIRAEKWERVDAYAARLSSSVAFIG